MRRRGLVLLTAGYVVALALLVSLPVGWSLNRLTVRLYSIARDAGMTQAWVTPELFGHLLNVLLFVPLGWLVGRLARGPWWVAVLGLALASAAVELTQWTILQREGQLVDVVTNTAGAAIGVWLARVSRE